MSDDEVGVLCVSVLLAGGFGFAALAPLVSVSRLHASGAIRGGVLGAWAFAMLLVHGTLATISASDVRTSVTYTAFYDVMGLAWLACSIAVFHRLGLSLRDDVIERRNAAALAALTGATLGIAMAFAGGNVGDGPGWWCVVFASGLATVSLFAIWIALHFAANAAETLTVERDVHAGVRVGALLAACGLVLGRAAAGDWISATDTAISFALAAWPALVIAALGIVVELVLRPRPRAPIAAPLAMGPGAAYLLVAAFVVGSQGVPS